MFGAESYVGIGGEMYHQLCALHRLRQTLPVEQVRLMKTKLRMCPRAFQKSLLSGRHVIEAGNAVARGKKAVDHVTADKARRAGDENAQSNLLMELKRVDQPISAFFLATFAANSSSLSN